MTIDGGLALVRMTLTPEADFQIIDSFSTTRASLDAGVIRLIDPVTKTTYLAARDEDDEHHILGSYSGFPARTGTPYTYFVYTAAPPAQLTSVTVDLGPLGRATVPIER